MEEPVDDPQWQIWRPPHGRKTRWAARLILLLLGACILAMAAIAVFGRS